MSRGGNTLHFRTLNEAELSDSLTYLTCSICEKVHTDPVFTPCHHTFCNQCIRQRLDTGEKSCPECARPLAADQLQKNLMAQKLLSSMKTCCMYKNYGCAWKGKVADLSLHQETCEYAVGECPNGCGTKLKRGQFRSHLKTCRLRPVNDCPCGTSFRFDQREQHQAQCLPYHRDRADRERSQRKKLEADKAALHEKLGQEQRTSRTLRLGTAEASIGENCVVLSKMLLGHILLAMLGESQRPDANVALGLYLIIAASRAEAGVAASRAGKERADLYCEEQGEHLGLLYFGQLLLAASLAADLAWSVLLGPLASFSLSPLSFSGLACESLTLPLACFVLKIVLFVPLSALTKAIRIRATTVEQMNEAGPANDDDSAASLAEQEKKPSAPRPLPFYLLLVGRTLFLSALWSSICRPDLSAALALLLLTHESPMYFSRVLLVVTVLAAGVDIAWLELAAFPGQLFIELPFSGKTGVAMDLLAALPRQTQLGVYATFASLSLKLLLLFDQIRLACAPVATGGYQGYDFDAADTTDAAADKGSSAADPLGLPPLLAPSRTVSLASDTASNKSVDAAERLERARRRRWRDKAEAEQKRRARGLFTLSVLILLLTAAMLVVLPSAVAYSTGGSGSAEQIFSSSPMEMAAFTMVVAFGCHRHTHVCASRPDRAAALLRQAALLLMALLVFGFLALVASLSSLQLLGDV